MIWRRRICCLAALALAGCMVGPDYERPQTSLPDGIFRRGAAGRRAGTDSGGLVDAVRRSDAETACS